VLTTELERLASARSPKDQQIWITELDPLTEFSAKASVALSLVECPLRMGVGGDLIAKL
jgi:hypothetical protein